MSTQFEHYPPTKVYRLIEPGPVLLVTTGSLKDGTHNVMTMGFHMVLQHEGPPLLGISLGPWDASFALLKKHRECVLAVPDVAMAATVVDIGNCSADDDDEGSSSGTCNKWERFSLEALPARKVKAPLVAGPNVIANIECGGGLDDGEQVCDVGAPTRQGVGESGEKTGRGRENVPSSWGWNVRGGWGGVGFEGAYGQMAVLPKVNYLCGRKLYF